MLTTLYSTKKVEHIQGCFALLGLTKPQTPVGDNGYHNSDYLLSLLSATF